MYKIGLIGVGSMGEALLSGVLTSGYASEEMITFTTKTSDRSDYIQSVYNVNPAVSNLALAQNSSIIILATKPSEYEIILAEIKDVLEPGQTVISLAPSFSLSRLRIMIDGRAQVVRAMPNTPTKIRKGVTGIAFDQGEEDDYFEVISLFNSVGRTIVVEEAKFPLVGTLSGSNPAFIEFIAKAMIDYGKENGLSEEEARFLVLNTLKGTTSLIKNSPLSLEQQIEQVCSKGGSTIEGIKTLENLAVAESVKQALTATTKRFKLMENE